MKKLAEKVALVAQMCITVVFVVTTVLCMQRISYYNRTVAPDAAFAVPPVETSQILFVLLLVLAALYAALAVYLLYVNFSQRANLKRILLFCDSDSATHTNIKVLSGIVRGCASKVKGISVVRISVQPDEKGGFAATFSVKANAQSVSQSVNKLRCLLEDSFKNTLGLTFNTINFNVTKLSGRYVPDETHAEQLAEALQEKQDECLNNYLEPIETSDAPHPADTPTNTEAEPFEADQH